MNPVQIRKSRSQCREQSLKHLLLVVGEFYRSAFIFVLER